jgi:uncharacterized protein (DUF3820 family)/ribosomal protein L37E
VYIPITKVSIFSKALGTATLGAYFFFMEISCKKCGLVNSYHVQQRGPHRTAYCDGCGAYIKHLPQEESEFIMPFGKYKGEPLSMMVSDDEIKYLEWVSEQPWLKGNVKTRILNHLNNS